MQLQVCSHCSHFFFLLCKTSGTGAIKVRRAHFLCQAHISTIYRYFTFVKVRLRSKLSWSNLYGPGAGSWCIMMWLEKYLVNLVWIVVSLVHIWWFRSSDYMLTAFAVSYNLHYWCAIWYPNILIFTLTVCSLCMVTEFLLHIQSVGYHQMP